MGLYINPKNDDGNQKAEIISKAGGVKVSLATFAAFPPGNGGEFGVIVVQNPGFQAAGIAFNKEERDRFVKSYLSHGDPRAFQCFLVQRETIKALDPNAYSGLPNAKA